MKMRGGMVPKAKKMDGFLTGKIRGRVMGGGGAPGQEKAEREDEHDSSHGPSPSRDLAPLL